MGDSECLCILPWLHRFTDEQGYHKLCCVGDGPSNQLCDSERRPLHVSQALADEQFLNSPDMRATRMQMLEGSWPAACERCRRSEAVGALSIRQLMDRRYRHRWPEVLKQTEKDGNLSHPKVRYADIRLGNVCNLTCRMCGPHASRLWADRYNAVQPPRYLLRTSLLTELKVNNWVKQSSLQWLIGQCLSTVESLRFAGGEPLIVPEMVEVLEACIRSGRAGEIELAYNTNITVLPERVTRLWPHFRSIDVMCSVDAVGPLNSYIRWPSKWSNIDSNLHKLDDHFREWGLRQVHLNTTVQIYNVLNLADIFTYVGTRFEHFDRVPKLLPLYYPTYMSIEHLPDHVKEIARRRLLAARAEAEQRLDDISKLSSVDTILAHLSRKADPLSMTDFLMFSERSDKLFKSSWREACPELDRLL